MIDPFRTILNRIRTRALGRLFRLADKARGVPLRRISGKLSPKIGERNRAQPSERGTYSTDTKSTSSCRLTLYDPRASKRFFKAQWKDPFKRFRKTGLPIIVSGIGVFLILGCLFSFIPWLVDELDLQAFTVFQIVLAVLLGSGIAFLGHFIQLREASRFKTIKVRLHVKKKG
jgi:hypothetical protein